MNTNTMSLQSVIEIRPTLPQKKAFVLRFSEDAGPQTGLFVGRVEHVTSGDQAAFSSVDQLFTFVRLVLARAEKPVALPPGAREARSRTAAGSRTPVAVFRG
jgi:hypothetical protein